MRLAAVRAGHLCAFNRNSRSRKRPVFLNMPEAENDSSARTIRSSPIRIHILAAATDIQFLVERGIAWLHGILVAQDIGRHVLGVGLSMADRRFGHA